MSDTWTVPDAHTPPTELDPIPTTNGKRRRRPDPKARLEAERAELKQIDKELRDAEQAVANLLDDRRITRRWINTNEALLGEKQTTWGEPRTTRTRTAAEG